MAELLTAKPVVARIADELAPRIAALASAGIAPTLGLIRVGERPDDVSYERTLMKRAESLGLATRRAAMPAEASTADVVAAIGVANDDEAVHGCLIFRPLPRGIDDATACAALDPRKDIDGITTTSLASVFMGGREGFPPSTASACIELLDAYGIPLEGKRVVVVGRSLVVGRPVACLALARNATVTLCHSRTADLPAAMRQADIVICATGRARAYGADCFAPGQVVLDVGINFDEAGQMCGDVDFDAVEPLVAAITPVPGGLGSVTTSVTMKHVVAAAEAAAAAR